MIKIENPKKNNYLCSPKIRFNNKTIKILSWKRKHY